MGNEHNSEERNKRRRGEGRVFLPYDSSFYWIAYCHRGKEIRESAREVILATAAKKRRTLSQEEARTIAERLLNRRLREIANEQDGLKVFVGPSRTA